MTMHPDEFECRLQRTPLRQPPDEWREHILNATADAVLGEKRLKSATRRRAFVPLWRARLRELLWPHPVAWGAIAAAWMAIGVLNANVGGGKHRTIVRSDRFYVVWQAMLIEQNDWQQEFFDRPSPNEPAQTNSQTAPRSECWTEWKMT